LIPFFHIVSVFIRFEATLNIESAVNLFSLVRASVDLSAFEAFSLGYMRGSKFFIAARKAVLHFALFHFRSSNLA
jgi:hypothetical protein